MAVIANGDNETFIKRLKDIQLAIGEVPTTRRGKPYLRDLDVDLVENTINVLDVENPVLTQKQVKAIKRSLEAWQKPTYRNNTVARVFLNILPALFTGPFFHLGYWLLDKLYVVRMNKHINVENTTVKEKFRYDWTKLFPSIGKSFTAIKEVKQFLNDIEKFKAAETNGEEDDKKDKKEKSFDSELTDSVKSEASEEEKSEKKEEKKKEITSTTIRDLEKRRLELSEQLKNGKGLPSETIQNLEAEIEELNKQIEKENSIIGHLEDEIKDKDASEDAGDSEERRLEAETKKDEEELKKLAEKKKALEKEQRKQNMKMTFDPLRKLADEIDDPAILDEMVKGLDQMKENMDKRNAEREQRRIERFKSYGIDLTKEESDKSSSDSESTESTSTEDSSLGRTEDEIKFMDKHGMSRYDLATQESVKELNDVLAYAENVVPTEKSEEIEEDIVQKLLSDLVVGASSGNWSPRLTDSLGSDTRAKEIAELVKQAKLFDGCGHKITISEERYKDIPEEHKALFKVKEDESSESEYVSTDSEEETDSQISKYI